MIETHPNVQSAWRDWSQKQPLHVVCAYNNPFRWRTRRHLMHDFRRHMSQSPNVILHVVELAYGDRPFEVTDATNPMDVQFRTSGDAPVWSKENLLNLGISRFGSDWQYGSYIDADFHMTRYDWALEAVHLLQHYDFVQLYSSYSALSSDHRPHKLSPSFAYAFLNARKGWRPAGKKAKDTYATPYWGATGGAWAFRRSALDRVGGMLDTSILGSGDWHMAYGLACQKDGSLQQYRKACPGYVSSVEAWQERAKALTGNIGCLDNHAIHYFHGDYKLRGYGERPQILITNSFDPQTDLSRDWQGLWQLTGNKPALRDDIRAYMLSRSEDDKALLSGQHLV